MTDHVRPAPVVTPDNAFYWKAAGRGEFVIQACGDCGQLQHRPLPICPACHSSNRVERPVSGRGSVSSFLIVHHPPNPWVALPVVLADVELAEGPHVTSNIVDTAPGDVVLDMEVEVLLAATDEPELGVPLFRPAGAR